jgi:hypothetical protein
MSDPGRFPGRNPAALPAGPEQATMEVATHVVSEAVWAPSVHNTQPWWFSVDLRPGK